ncbi:MAG: translation initiation factor [Ferruginibacter sp.]
MAKNKSTDFGIVYSTDPDFKLPEDDAVMETQSPALQKIKIRLETKHRGGKAVTLIDGYIGTDEDAQELGKKLKTFCGTGGSVKDRVILVQGDHRDKALVWLLKMGYQLSKKI